MNYAFYILPVLLAVSIPNALAEVGQNYDTVINDDGSITWTSHPERILVNNEWQNYFLEVNESKVIFNSNSVGSFIFDKDTCSYSIYENGWATPETQIIPSVSSVATYLKNGIWENMEVNNLSCEVTVEEFEDRVILKSVKEDVTKYEQEIILDIREGFKETFRIIHSGSEQLGISQTVHTGESITIADQTINIEALNGQSFDRQFIIDNRAEILQIADNLNYDFDVGINSLSAIHIIFDGDYKVNMDYSDGSFVNFLEIDPTFTSSGTRVGHSGVANTASSCSTSGAGSFSGTEIGYYSTSYSFGCYVLGFYWDISSISDSATISDVSLEYDVLNITNGRNCNFNSIEGTLSTDGYAVAYPDIFGSDGTTTSYVSNDGSCKIPNSTQTIDLGINADSDFQNDLSTDEFGIGIVYYDSSRDGNNHTTSIPTAEISVTYSVASKPDAITDLSGSFNNPNVDLTFSTPADGGSAITSFKIYRDSGSGYSLIDTVSSSSLTSYQDTSATSGVNNSYKVNAVNAISEANDSNVATVFTGTPPGNPTGLTSTIQDPDNSPLDVYLQWSSPTNVGTGSLTGFEVYRNGVLVTTTGLVNSYTDTVTQGSHSHYVKAVSTHGTSGNSNTANITTPNVPDAITDLSGNVISDTQINISWTAPNDGGSNIDLYKIFRDGSQIDTTTNTSYSLTGLTQGTSYTITVYSNNSVGDSLVSNSVTLTTYIPISGSITVTPNTQGATTQLTFSASGITGTPTPTFNTFTLKEGVNVIASGISSPYTLTLNDSNSHTYTVTSTDNTHWNTPTISGSTTVTATYDPNWSNGISYNFTRSAGVTDLIVNRDIQSLWDASCNYKTTAQVMADQTGIVSNFTNVWYINDSQNIADTETIYVSCSENGTTLFSFTSFGPNRLGGGIAQLDAVFGEWTGTPVALIFVLLVAGLFTGRSAPTGILLVLALIGVLGFIGMLTIDQAVWGFLLLAGVLGIFLGKRFL